MLAVDSVGVAAGAVEILAGVSLGVSAGRILGLVGPNGAGKTTLLDAVSGLVPVASGTVRLGDRDITRLAPHRRARLGLARTFQSLDLFDDLDARENVLVTLRDRIGSQGSRRPVKGLSHGERKTVALDRALATGPQVLLLDEPAAGLDAAGRRVLNARLRHLAAEGLALVLADHDIDLVMDVADDVCVLDLGRVIGRGPPGVVRADPAVVAAYLGAAGAEPRPAGPRPVPGDLLLEARGLTAGYGGAPAVAGLDLTVRAGEVVALLGPNGAGKTTTLRALSGLLRPTAGEVTVLGGRLAGPHRLARRGLAHVPQDRAVLPSLTVGENLRLARRTGPAPDDPFPALGPLRDRRAGRLSGGEQQLLALARALASGPRLLLVDELSLGLAPAAARRALEAVTALAPRGAGCVLAEQHPALALEVADRAVVLVAGRCRFDGPAAELVARPGILRAAYLGTPE